MIDICCDCENPDQPREASEPSNSIWLAGCLCFCHPKLKGEYQGLENNINWDLDTNIWTSENLELHPKKRSKK